MKRQFLYLLFLPLFFGNCRKPQELKVTYKVIETSSSNPSYTITYTSDKSGNTNVASSSEQNWSSDVMLLEEGEFISMKTECTAPEFEIKMNIYVNGFLWKTETFSDPVVSKELKGTL